MGRLVDLAGRRFGRLVVEHKTKPNKSGAMRWLCVCDCGNQKEICGKHLRSGKTRSCGCYRAENTSEMFTKHGLSGSRIYTIWIGMKDRCSNPKNVEYAKYGGRGIEVCDEWKHFEPFHSWAVANGYRDDLSIDRIDNDGDYEPSNCRWATCSEQANNTSRSHVLEYNGESRTVREWENVLGVRKNTIRQRIWRGWSVERALKTPERGR